MRFMLGNMNWLSFAAHYSLDNPIISSKLRENACIVIAYSAIIRLLDLTSFLRPCGLVGGNKEAELFVRLLISFLLL